MTTSQNYNELIDYSLTGKVAKKEEIQKLMSKYGVNMFNMKDKEQMQKLGMTDEEIDIILWAIASTFKETDLDFNLVKMPDFVREVMSKYGLNQEAMKDDEKLRKLILTDEDPKTQHEYEMIVNFVQAIRDKQRVLPY